MSHKRQFGQKKQMPQQCNLTNATVNKHVELGFKKSRINDGAFTVSPGLLNEVDSEY